MPELSLSDAHDTDERLCANGCREPAAGERTVGVASDGTEVAELLCRYCLEEA